MINISNDKAILDLNEYNRLRDLDDAIKNGKKLVINYSYIAYASGFRFSERTYFTDSEIVVELSQTYESLLNDYCELYNKCNKLAVDNDALTKSLNIAQNRLLSKESNLIYKFFNLFKRK